MFESRAQQTYLVNKYKPDSSLYPTNPEKRAKIDEALYFAASSLTVALTKCLVSGQRTITGKHRKVASETM